MIVLQFECPIDGLPLGKTMAVSVHVNEKVADHQEDHIHYTLVNEAAACLNGHVWQLEQTELILTRIKG